MTAVHFPGLSGVLPDYGRFDPLDWGLGVQLNTDPATWMGTRTSAQDLRALRRLRNVPLGRPAGADRVRGADGSRVRRLGEGSLARALRCRVWPSSRAMTTGRGSGFSLTRFSRECSVLGEERPQQLVEGGLVAARHHTGRHRGHRRRSGHVHHERDLAEELSRPQDPLARPSIAARRRRLPRAARRTGRRGPPRGRGRCRKPTSSRCIRSASFASVSPGSDWRRPTRASSVTDAGTWRGDTRSTVPRWASWPVGATALAVRRNWPYERLASSARSAGSFTTRSRRPPCPHSSSTTPDACCSRVERTIRTPVSGTRSVVFSTRASIRSTASGASCVEETGAEVEPGAFLGAYVDTYGDGPDATSVLNLVWEARIVSGDPAPADDVSELRWFPRDAPPPPEECAFRWVAKFLHSPNSAES